MRGAFRLTQTHKEKYRIVNTRQARLEAKPRGWNRFAVLFITVAALGLTLIYADIDISFNSTFDALNRQSDGAPMDTTFTFELGSFDPSFTPTADNTDLWMSNWVPVPGDGSSSAAYTQVPLGSLTPNTGASNTFSGSVTLDSNTSPFGTTDQAYIWGFDDRDGSGTGEWILLTNADWQYPLVTDDVQFPETFSVGDVGTYAVLGSVNPLYAGGSDPPHMITEQVILAPVPEPSVAILLLGGAGLLALRRRR